MLAGVIIALVATPFGVEVDDDGSEDGSARAFMYERV